MMKNRRVLFVMVAQLVSMVLTAGNATDQQGFVIVSADDRTQPILGYSDQGTLDISNLPPNAKAWLESYARQVQALDNGATATETGTQFQLSNYKRLIDIYSSTAKTVDALMKLELPSGVEVEIKV